MFFDCGWYFSPVAYHSKLFPLHLIDEFKFFAGVCHQWSLPRPWSIAHRPRALHASHRERCKQNVGCSTRENQIFHSRECADANAPFFYTMLTHWNEDSCSRNKKVQFLKSEVQVKVRKWKRALRSLLKHKMSDVSLKRFPCDDYFHFAIHPTAAHKSTSHVDKYWN